MKNKIFKIFMVCLLVVVYFIVTEPNERVEAANEWWIGLGDTYDVTENIVEFGTLVDYYVATDGIISMNSEGIITGLQPGKTYVTITYIDTSNNECTYSYDVTVYMNPGVYRIKNVQSGKYLSMSDIKLKKSSSVIFADSANALQNETDYLLQLWKIDCDNSLTDFTIQPYVDNNSILVYSVYDNEIMIDDMPSFMDYTYSYNTMWCIESSEIYTLKYNGKNYRLNELNVYGAGSESDTWEFEQVSTIPNGIELIDEYYEDSVNVQKRYISRGSKKSLADLKIRVLSYYNGSSSIGVQWSSSNNSIARVNPTTGEVTGVNAGVVTINATYYPGATAYTESYTLEVMPYRDGGYRITSRLGYYGLRPANVMYGDFVGRYLIRNFDNSGNSFFYIQAMIDGTYKISVANCREIEPDYWVTRDVDSGCLEVLNYGAYMTNKSTWTIRDYELGSTISYKNNNNYSWTLNNYSTNLVELCYPDYEDYDSMWSINESIVSKPTIHIHPYYDSQFLANFNNDSEAAIEALNGYLNYAKNIFESELEVNIVIEDPVEFVLTEAEAQKLNQAEVKNPNGVNDDVIYTNAFNDMISEIAAEDEYYLNTNKFILYQAYNFIDIDGNEYVPRSYNAYDRSFVYCTNGNYRNNFATLHELSHTLGIPDHYHNNDGENGECTVGDRCSTCGTFSEKRTNYCAICFDDYDEEEPFCDDCVLELNATLFAKSYPQSTEE